MPQRVNKIAATWVTDTYLPEMSVCKATRCTSHQRTGAQQAAAEGKDSRQPGLRGGDHRTLHTFSSSIPGRILFYFFFFFLLQWLDEVLVLQCFSKGTEGKNQTKTASLVLVISSFWPTNAPHLRHSQFQMSFWLCVEPSGAHVLV